MPVSSKSDLPVVVVKWFDYLKWVLERAESFPKRQRFVLGQRLSNHVMEVLELLVEAAYSREKKSVLAQANRKMEVGDGSVAAERGVAGGKLSARSLYLFQNL